MTIDTLQVVLGMIVGVLLIPLLRFNFFLYVVVVFVVNFFISLVFGEWRGFLKKVRDELRKL